MNTELWFAIASLAIGLLASVFSALAALIAFFIKRGEDAQDRIIAEQKDSVDGLVRTVEWMRSELTHLSASLASIAEERLRDIAALHTDLKDHVMREESIFWRKVDSIQETSRVQYETLLLRITQMEGKLPNGEIERLAIEVAKIVEQVISLKEKSQSALDHARNHDSEADDFRRKLDIDGERLDRIEEEMRGKAYTRRRPDKEKA